MCFLHYQKLLGFDLSLSALSTAQERFCITEFRETVASDMSEEQGFRFTLLLQWFP